MTKQVLVTGGTGFTGGHLCQRLVKEGHAVRALVRPSTLQNSDATGPLKDLGVELIAGDLCDAGSLKAAVAGVDTVYHIAALFRPENVTRQEFWAANVEGTRNLIEAATEAKVNRFVHCSTIGVHGEIKQPPATECRD